MVLLLLASLEHRSLVLSLLTLPLVFVCLWVIKGLVPIPAIEDRDEKSPICMISELVTSI